MSDKFCTNCAAKLMPTMLICPNCGNKNFASTPPVTRPSVALKTSTIGGIQNAFMTPAGNGARFVAAFVDLLLLVAIAIVLALVLVGLYNFGDNNRNPGSWIAAHYLVSALINWCYFINFHSSVTGATPGKRVVNIRVVTMQGERLTKYKAFIRLLCAAATPIILLLVLMAGVGVMGAINQIAGDITFVVGFLAVSLGPFATVFFTKNHLTLIDMICKTRVINK